MLSFVAAQITQVRLGPRNLTNVRVVTSYREVPRYARDDQLFMLMLVTVLLLELTQKQYSLLRRAG
jgi:hypothetical protein